MPIDKTLEEATKDYKTAASSFGAKEGVLTVGSSLLVVVIGTLILGASGSYFSAFVVSVIIWMIGVVVIMLSFIGISWLKTRGKGIKSDYQIIRESMVGAQVVVVTPYKIVIEQGGHRYSFGTGGGSGLLIDA